MDEDPASRPTARPAAALAGFVRNAWPDSTGTGGRIPPECVAGFNRNQWPECAGIRNLKRWPTLFIGYSLMDYNLRLLFQTLRWKVDRARFPMAYSVDPYPDPLLEFTLGAGLQRQVIFIAQDVWTFVPALYRAVVGEDPPV